MNELQIKNLTKTFSINDKQNIILNNVSFSFSMPEILVLLGKSGGGKTTLLRCIKGLDKNYKGEIINNLSIGLIFQEPRLMPWLSVYDNIVFGLKKENIKKSKNKIDKIINLVGLSQYINYKPYELSGGMSQRVALARTLVCDNQIILMDEPFSALDFQLREKLQNELINISKKMKIGIIFVTHNIDEALKIANRILILNNHNIIKEFVINDCLEENKKIQIKQEIINLI